MRKVTPTSYSDRNAADNELDGESQSTATDRHNFYV